MTLRRLLIASLVTCALACSEKSAPPGAAGSAGATEAEPCPVGQRGCACYGNQTCDRGSSCEGELCVAELGSGGEGDGGSLGGAAPGPRGGTGGAGGSLGSGGEPAAGGDGGQAAGGSSHVGGSSVGGTSAQSPDNLVSNGSFDAELADWVANPDIGDIASDGSKGRACFTTESSGQFTLAWPADFARAFTIEPGKNYRLSYRAVSTLGIEISVQIRMPESPYDFYFSAREPLTETWTAHSHSFSLDSGSSHRGLAFIGSMPSPGTTCFDDVVLERAPAP